MSVEPSADLHVILVEKEAQRGPVVEVLLGYASPVEWVIRLMEFAYQTGKSPIIPSQALNESGRTLPPSTG